MRVRPVSVEVKDVHADHLDRLPLPNNPQGEPVREVPLEFFNSAVGENLFSFTTVDG
jgi:hypothetical protein